jgi:hypothetical protein
VSFIKNHIESYRSIATILNTQTIKNWVENENFTVTKAKIKKHCNLPAKAITYQTAITKIYKDLYDSHRNEYVFKNELINSQIVDKLALSSTTIISEFKIANSIADLVFFNGSIKVFEIKTDFDNLDKLDKQLNNYRKFAQEIYIVTSLKFSDTLLTKYKKTPYGVMVFLENGNFEVIKKSIKCIKFLNHEVIFKTLRKQEYLNIIINNFGYIPCVPNTLFYKACFELIQTIDVKVFQKLVLKEIKNRKLKDINLFENKKTLSSLNHSLININIDSEAFNKLTKLLKNTIN